MPLTDTLKTAEELRRAGFTENQANVLAGKFEETAQAQSQDLKEFIRGELTAFEARLEARLDARFEGVNTKFEGVNTKFEGLNARIEAVRAELYSAQRDQLLKFVTILMALLSIAVAVIKLFPDLN